MLNNSCGGAGGACCAYVRSAPRNNDITAIAVMPEVLLTIESASCSEAAKTDGAVTGGNVERLPAAIQFASNGIGAGGPFHLKRNSETDVAVVGMRIDIGLKVVRKRKRDAAVAGTNRPPRR